MKKTLVIILIATMLLSLVACGSNSENPSGSSSGTSIQGNSGGDEKEFDSFSVDAVSYFLEKATGLKLAELEPDWEWTLKGNYSAYGDSPNGTGHAVIAFTKAEGEVTDDEYNAWLQKVFDATAKASQDGYNIIGHEFAGDGEDAHSETTLEAAMESFIPGWAFRKDGTIFAVYVSESYDNDKDSELGKLFYYDGVKIDVGYGMQMSWDDYDEYIEDNMDEIEDALGG